MSKIRRTLTMDSDISRALSQICVRHGDATWHVEQALAAYKPIKQLLAKVEKPVPAKLKRKALVIPNYEQVANHFWETSKFSDSKIAQEEASAFLDYWTKHEWKRNGKKVVDWTLNARTWIKNCTDGSGSHENSNRSGQQFSTSKPTARERVAAARIAKSGGNGNVGRAMDHPNGDLYDQVPTAGQPDGCMGETIQGSYTVTG